MSFLAPLWLLVGAAAAVPLLLHLLRRNIATRVDFPAARYLQRAEQEHSRSLRIRNLLLMLLRVLLILALALAAARPFISGVGVGHGPTAMAVVLDNSLSTTAVVSGTPVFARLRAAAHALLLASEPADQLWLVTADGRVRGGTREALIADLARLTPTEDAGDLPLALRRAAAAVQSSLRPTRAVAVATDGQRTAWASVSRVDVPVALLVPGGTPPRNRAVLSAQPEPVRWTPRGTVLARLQSTDSVGYRVLLGERTLARGSATGDEPVQLRLSPPERGWLAMRVELDPDDFAADDARQFAVWIGAAPAVTVDASAGPFISTAASVLLADGRVTTGGDVRIASADAVTQLPALIVPPADPVRLGAANRALERLGVPWRYGTVDRTGTIARGKGMEAITVSARYRLERDGVGATDTLATAGGEPWVVAGAGYILVGSVLDPGSTSLPVRAAFVPWLAEAVGLRLGARPGDLAAPITARPGATVRLPTGVTALENEAGARRTIAAEQIDAPETRGVWYLLRGARRAGALVVNAPPEESVLNRELAERLAPRLSATTARVAATANGWVRDAFASGTRRSAVTPLLLLALVLLAAEAITVRAARSTRSIAA